ncbi:hypothetical protein KM043_004535 [Ampulex compressa]|nr:hypothetical protein KM043_004535 [Ampulex compressa]
MEDQDGAIEAHRTVRNTQNCHCHIRSTGGSVSWLPDKPTAAVLDRSGCHSSRRRSIQRRGLFQTPSSRTPWPRLPPPLESHLDTLPRGSTEAITRESVSPRTRPPFCSFPRSEFGYARSFRH